MPESPAKLATVIGHRFKDPKILERALTHRSWAYENLPGASDEVIRDGENESMEFVGDSVLGLVIAEKLFSGHPKSNEGELTLMKHALVSTATLARVAEEMKLGDYLRVGRGEEKTGGRKKQALLANTLEAVIAAVFLDGGYSAARLFIGRVFDNEMSLRRPVIPSTTTMLQERRRCKDAVPRLPLRDIRTPHSRRFTVEAVWETVTTRAEGKTIKSAEMKLPGGAPVTGTQ